MPPMAWADSDRCISHVGEVSIARWLLMSAAAMSASMSAGRSAALAASKPWTTASLRTLDIQNRVPGRSSPAALNTGASSASSEHALATRCADADSHPCHWRGPVGSTAISVGSCVGSVMRRSMISATQCWVWPTCSTRSVMVHSGVVDTAASGPAAAADSARRRVCSTIARRACSTASSVIGSSSP